MEKFYSTIRGLGLKRGPQRWLGGVCGGIAAKLNVDVAFVRIALQEIDDGRRLLPDFFVQLAIKDNWTGRRDSDGFNGYRGAPFVC